MEIIPKGRNFRIVADKELLSILDVLQGYLPNSIKFHETVKTYLKDKVWQFYFYVTTDWPSVKLCLHFPGCTLTPNNELYESFGVFCPIDQLEYLQLLHDEDILIDWNKIIYVNFAQEVVINQLEPFYQSIGSIEQVSAEVFTYDINAVLPNIEKFPNQEEVELRALSLKDSKDIHDLYPAGNMESIEVFQKLLDKLPGCGVFSKKEGELLAWMVQSYYGAMFSMQTKPSHRRKGYGIWLAKTLTEIVIKRGYLPFVVIRPENNARSSGAVPFSTLIALLALWFGVSVPLTFAGAYIGFRKRPLEHPVRTNQIPRQIPDQSIYTQAIPGYFMGGVLPFGCIFIQLFFILNSIWSSQHTYYMFGFLFLVFLILVITCSETTILLCYFHLCAEDYHWWWRSFLTSGFTAGYLFVYCCHYFVTKLQIEDTASTFLYFGYTIIMVFLFFLLTGSIGFFSCFWFIRKIYSVVKVD